MANARVPEKTMLDYFQKVFLGCLHAISRSDEQFLREYMESRMVDRILESNRRLRANNLYLKVDSDFQQDAQRISTFCEIIDGIVIKGISQDREANGDIAHYRSWSDLEDMGVAVYRHTKYTDPANFIEPGQNRGMYDDYEKVLLRLLLSIKTPYLLNIMQSEHEAAPTESRAEGAERGQEPADFEKYDPFGTKQSSRAVNGRGAECALQAGAREVRAHRVGSGVQAERRNEDVGAPRDIRVRADRAAQVEVEVQAGELFGVAE